MPLDRFVLILVIVLAAGAVTVWLGWLLMAAVAIPDYGWLIFVPVALVAVVAARVVIDRIRNKDDNHYDRIEK
ncbi:MAG: hypothetical protein HRU32_05490 [Rhodobacteraceae bacterium]|nr:hypothetical protein [Paracoccaceae bacterium]